MMKAMTLFCNVSHTQWTALDWSNFILQQDNDPNHSSKLCKNYLEKKAAALSTIEWPAQSPDLNPI